MRRETDMAATRVLIHPGVDDYYRWLHAVAKEPGVD